MLDVSLGRCSSGIFGVCIGLLCGPVDCSGNRLFVLVGVLVDQNTALGLLTTNQYDNAWIIQGSRRLHRLKWCLWFGLWVLVEEGGCRDRFRR